MHEYWNDPTWWAMLEAILACGDDDLPRLVAADWLEERGHADRAEFIRLQCKMARNHEGKGQQLPKADPKDTRRVHALIRKHKAAWLAPLRPVEPQESTLVGQYTVGVGNSTMRVVCVNGEDPLIEEDTVRVEFTRGFVRKVNGWMPTLHGGRCEECENGFLTWEDDDGEQRILTDEQCSFCDGTGTVVSPLPAILRREPVAAVEVYGRESHQIGTLGESWWYDERDADAGGAGESRHTSHLPGDLFDAIAVDCEYIDSDLCIAFKRFDSRLAAKSALSDAIIAVHKPKLVESPK